MVACANKIKGENAGNKKTVKKGLRIPMILDGGKGKTFTTFVLLRIFNIRREK